MDEKHFQTVKLMALIIIKEQQKMGKKSKIAKVASKILHTHPKNLTFNWEARIQALKSAKFSRKLKKTGDSYGNGWKKGEGQITINIKGIYNQIWCLLHEIMHDLIKKNNRRLTEAQEHSICATLGDDWNPYYTKKYGGGLNQILRENGKICHLYILIQNGYIKVNKDGTIDRKCKAVKEDSILVRKDGHIDQRTHFY